MCELMEEYSRAREKIAEAKGREESAKEFVESLWADGIRDMERISKLTKLSIEDVKKLIEGKSA